MILFPETEVLTIQEAVNKASNEEMAVCDLLLKGEPLVVVHGVGHVSRKGKKKKKGKNKRKHKNKSRINENESSNYI